MHLLPRELSKHVQHALTTDRVVAIMGPRQAGKTTLVQHLLQSKRSIQYYNLKDPEIRRGLQTNARREFDHFVDHLIVLDEVQQVPSLLELIQLQVDARPEAKGRFLLLGSNHLLLNRQIRESLAGRVALYTLYPFSFRELAGRTQTSLLGALLRVSSVPQAEKTLAGFYIPAEESGTLAAHFDDLALYGGYPEFLTRPDPEDRRRWLNSYHQTYLDADLRELVDLRQPESFERFERLFSIRVGSLLNISELARDCGLAADTIRRFLHYYRQLFVAWPSLPYHANLGKRMMKMPKWYFTDTGLLRSVLDNFRADDGHLFENTVLSELRKLIYLETLREDFHFARTATGVEVDAVFANSQSDVIFHCEVKLSSTAYSADIRHLRKYVALSENHIGLLLNTSKGIEKLDDRIWSLPVSWMLA
ncbi:MAG: ATP-binding protein [Gemmatimonadetes bacterium]|nr:ATP-binding protein [Gemmatimonadota bacterium]